MWSTFTSQEYQYIINWTVKTIEEKSLDGNIKENNKIVNA